MMTFDPDKVTKYDRTTEELEEFLLFCFINHGKIAKMQALKLKSFLSLRGFYEFHGSPFSFIRFLSKNNLLEQATRKVKFGQYRVVDRGFKEIAYSNMNLKTCSPEDLESIYGLGFKSSRYFILHSRIKEDIAILDVHILRWLKSLGYEDVPSQAPQSAKIYQKWEKIFLKECESRNMRPADLDLEIWKSRRIEYVSL